MTDTLLSGPKFSSAHQTVIQDAVPVLKRLKALDAVRKIVIGRIDTFRGSGRKIKLVDIDAGLKATITACGQSQTFYFYCDKNDAQLKRVLNDLSTDFANRKAGKSKKKTFKPRDDAKIWRWPMGGSSRSRVSKHHKTSPTATLNDACGSELEAIRRHLRNGKDSRTNGDEEKIE